MGRGRVCRTDRMFRHLSNLKLNTEEYLHDGLVAVMVAAVTGEWRPDAEAAFPARNLSHLEVRPSYLPSRKPWLEPVLACPRTRSSSCPLSLV